MRATSISSVRAGARSGVAVSASPWQGLSPRYVRDAAAQRLKALGHPDRLRIVEVLTHRPTTVGEVAARLGLSLEATSRHMGIMHAAGIVECSRHGNHVVYALDGREGSQITAIAYRSAALQARRIIAAAPKPPRDHSSTSSP